MHLFTRLASHLRRVAADADAVSSPSRRAVPVTTAAVLVVLALAACAGPSEPGEVAAPAPSPTWSGVPAEPDWLDEVPSAADLRQGRARAVEHEQRRADAQAASAKAWQDEQDRLAAEQAAAEQAAAEQAAQAAAEQAAQAAARAPSRDPKPSPHNGQPPKTSPPPPPAPQAPPQAAPPSTPSGPPGVPGTVRLTNRSCTWDGTNFHMKTTGIFENGYTQTVVMVSSGPLWSQLWVDGVEYYPNPDTFADVCQSP